LTLFFIGAVYYLPPSFSSSEEHLLTNTFLLYPAKKLHKYGTTPYGTTGDMEADDDSQWSDGDFDGLDSNDAGGDDERWLSFTFQFGSFTHCLLMLGALARHGRRRTKN